MSSAHPVYGYAAQTGKLGFDGDVQSITLQLNRLSTVRGVVYAIDGRTPVPGAAVRIEDGRQNPGIFTTLPDGSFEFKNVAAGVGFQLVADITQDGTYRTGVASGRTPGTGGPVEGVAVVLRTQGSIDGRIVYAGFRKYDPQNSANNIVDDTPGDLSDNAPVPLANFSLRELDFPYRSFGTTADPITADISGRFSINNVFTGALRVSASDPGNQEARGAWSGSITQEGQRITAYVGIGAEGFGPVTISVVDPNSQNAPVLNAEVTLQRNGVPFDLSSTDGAGNVRFEQVPVGTYRAAAYSKALGRSGSTANFTVAAIAGASARISLEFSGKVNGKLTDPQAAGRGIPGAQVTLSEQSFLTRASTDVGGDFIFDGVREGLFRLDAKDTLSNRRATATHDLTQADPNPFISLQLEPTETLFLSVYLPDDTGGNSNVLAPVVNLDVSQRNNDYQRTLQGNVIQMAGLFRNEAYGIDIKEIGGDAREIHYSGTFPKGSSADPLKLVLPAFGAAEVHVLQGSSPAANAKVTVSGGGRLVTVYTDASGVALARGIPLGAAFVQVVSVDGAFSGSANTAITSQSNAAVVSLTLGAYAGVTGLVDAELGGPSAGTRVIVSFGRILEALTDSTGRYTFQGIPTSTRVDLTYMGPNDVTVGARQSVNIGAGDASRVIEAPKVRLDATPPQVVSIFPADNASNISPDSSVKIVFSEAIQSGYLNTNYLQLIPADSSTPVATSFSTATGANGVFTITMTPPGAPAGQLFPLKSNTLYRIIVSGSIVDLTGNKLPAARGASFITSDYAEPHVIKVVPATTTALQPATTFEFRFNEPIDAGAWQSGGSGVFHLYKISAAGPAGAVVADLPGRAYVDPANGLSLFYAPNAALEQESFYRVVFSGVRDLQGNLLAAQTFHFFSYDAVKPFVNLVSPVPATFPLISGVEYVLTSDVRNAASNGTPATDVAKVDYFRVDGVTQTFLTTVTSTPWSYRFVAPDAPTAGSTLTLRAIATDLSGNESVAADITWTVKPNQAPQNVTVTMTPATAVYPGTHVYPSVKFQDEGTFATVQIDAQATQNDGSTYTSTQNKTVTRVKVDDAWPDALFDFNLPPSLKGGTRVTFTANVTDVRGIKGVGTGGTDLTLDTIAPVVVTVSPAPQTHYRIGDKYQVVAVISDFETGAAEATFSIDGQTTKVTVPGPLVTLSGDHTWTFTTGNITVPAKNADTTIPISV
ncbi:MAG: Ig-like domain-containing protein, partial [Acidobacteriota bacterium]